MTGGRIAVTVTTSSTVDVKIKTGDGVDLVVTLLVDLAHQFRTCKLEVAGPTTQGWK